MAITWPDHLTSQGYTATIGQDHDAVSGLVVPVVGKFYRPGFPLSPGVAGSQPGRYDQRDSAGPLYSEASFVDPSVLDDFARDKGLDLVRATDSDREDIRWVTQPGSSVTFYAGVLRPWLLERKPKVDAVGQIAALNAKVDDLDHRLAALESKGKKS